MFLVFWEQPITGREAATCRLRRNLLLQRDLQHGTGAVPAQRRNSFTEIIIQECSCVETPRKSQGVASASRTVCAARSYSATCSTSAVPALRRDNAEINSLAVIYLNCVELCY